MVRKAVNVRVKPDQYSKKIGGLAQGERIFAVGRTDSGWVAFREQDKDIGFVSESMLFPVVDSALTEEIAGTVFSDGQPKCDYIITFVGKSEAEGQMFLIGDYEVDWNCQRDGVRATFSTPMFLTEGPYISKEPSIHQITIDILDLAINLEEVLSTNLFYDHELMRVVYDGTSSAKLSRSPAPDEAQVASLADALHASVRLTYEAWNETLWGELMKRRG